MTQQKFTALHQQAYENYQKSNHQSNQIAVIRFILGISVIIFLMVGYFQQLQLLYIVSLICLVCFIIMIRYHDRIKKECLYQQSLSKVFNQHLQRMNNQWTEFTQTGDEFLDEKDHKAIDLDILSHHSLFQMINIAFTQLGQQRFAKTLLNDDVLLEEIHQRQAAVLEMSQHTDFVFKVQTLGTMIKTQKEDVILKFIKQKQSYQKITPLIFIVSFLTVISMVCLFFSIGYPYTQVIFEVGAVFQFCFAFLYYHQHSLLFDPVNQVSQSMKSYLEIFKTIQDTSFESEILKNIHDDICQKGHVVEGIEELSKISQKIASRQNIFVLIIFNALGLYDFYIRNQYLSWYEKYHHLLSQWFDGLAEIETYMSLSVLKIDDFDVIMPTIINQQTLSFTNLKHPLIDQEKVVGNDFDMNGPLCVITGSNMSGKTTFMRTIGLNLVLAYAGGFVFADKMTCSPMHIMTSMRVKDNVEEGISTFYGELLRIKEMIAYSKKNIPMICLIDEIFKGTNSLDRIAGAKATMDKLSMPHIYTFLTTHDFELCHHDSQNYHFDEYYQDEHIYFDYQIKKGKSKSTNGQFLLKQLGILDQ